MGSIIDRALDIINDHLKDQTSSFQVASPLAAGRAMARGGHVLEDDYPTHYLPNVGRQVMADGGMPDDPVGGALDVAQSIPETPMPSLQPTPPAPSVPSAEGRVVKKDTRPRMMNDIGHYSAAAEAASSLKQEKGPASQMIGALKNMPGVKPEEIKWSGVESAFDPKEVITKDDLVNHFNKNLPEIKETKLGRDRIHIVQNEEEPHIFEVYHAGDPEGQYYGQVGEIIKNPAGRYTINVPGVSKHNFATIEEAKDYVNRVSDVGTTTKFHGYTLPDGENYREVLLHLPPKKNAPIESGPSAATMLFENNMKDKYGSDNFPSIYNKLSPSEIDKYEMLVREDRNSQKTASMLQDKKKNFKSSHWEEPNILAHLRMSDRTGENGEKILHLEELQSDWAQKAREARQGEVKRVMREKGLEKEEANKLVPSGFGFQNPNDFKIIKDRDIYRVLDESGKRIDIGGSSGFSSEQQAKDEIAKNLITLPGLPNAPYVANTQNWVDLGLKRALREAAKGGYDKLIWTPGEEQAERYDLSKHIKSVTYDPNEQHLSAIGHDGREVLSESGIEPHELDEHVGKEVAEKLRREADNATSAFNEYEIHKDPETKKWGLNLYGEPHYDYGGDEVLFDSKSEAQDYLREMVDEDIKRNPPTISGLDLKVGGEGMHAFYDKMVPTQLSKMVKKLDPSAKIEMGAHKLENEDGKEVKAHALHITPELRQKILDGLPAYAGGGAVEDGDDKNSVKLEAINDEDYRGFHRAPGPDEGAPLWRMHDLYPDDLYSSKGFRYYADYGNPYDMEGYQRAVSYVNQPNRSVTIYRAVPKEASIKNINPGDWVTLTRGYAKTHGDAVLRGEYKILKKMVKARDLFTHADSIHEFGYAPQSHISDKEIVSRMSDEEAKNKLEKLSPNARTTLKRALEERMTPAKSYGGGIDPIELRYDNLEDQARRLILWSYAAAPLGRPLARAEGGAIDDPVNKAASIVGAPAFQSGGDVDEIPIIDRAFKVLSKFSR